MDQRTVTRTGGHDELAQQDLALAAGDDQQPGPDPEAGMATAEYAIATLAAAGLAGLLVAILRSDTLRGLIEGVITSAFSIV